jgi:ABC-type lipoprotein release transport system permease subunit
MWVRSERRGRRASLLGLALAIAVAVGSTLALAAGAHRADTAFDRFASRTGAATIVLSEPDGGLPTSAAQANRHLVVLDRVRAIDGVESVQVETWFGAFPTIFEETSNFGGRLLAFSQGFTYFDRSHPPFLVVAGTVPAADDPEGIAINEAAASAYGLKVGSRVDFDTASPAHFAEWGKADGTVKSYDGPRVHAVVRVIGRSFNEIVAPGTPDIALLPGIAAAMGDSVLECACFVSVRIRPNKIDEVRTQLDAIYRPYGFVERPGNSAAPVTEAIRVEVTTLWIAALVAVLAALLVVAQITARSATSMASRNDARRALGMVRGQRAAGAGLVLAPAVLLGSVVGGVVAYFLSGLFPRGLALKVEPEPGLRLDSTVLFLGGVGFLLALALLVAVVAWRTAGMAKATSPKRPHALTRVFAGNPQRSLGTRFALDPVGGRAAPVISLATLVGIALTAGGVVAVTTIQQSRDDARTHHQIFGAPADYWFDDNGSIGAPAAIEFAQRQPGVTAITRTVSIDDATTPATGPAGKVTQVEPTSFEPLRGGALPTLTNGSMPRGNDEVTLGKATARALGARLGDAVTVTDVNGSTRTFRVVGLVVSWGSEDPGHAFVVNPDTLLSLLCTNSVASGCNVRISAWVAAAHSAAAPLARAGFVRIGPPANLDRLQQVGNIPWYLAGVLAVLGLAGLSHALSTALRRRRIDLAIGRALGWTPQQSAGVLVWQSVLTSLAGGLVGATLGLLTGRALWTVIAGGLDIVLRPVVPLGVAALTVASLVIASIVVSVPAFVRACRLPTSEILRIG